MVVNSLAKVIRFGFVYGRKIIICIKIVYVTIIHITLKNKIGVGRVIRVFVAESQIILVAGFI